MAHMDKEWRRTDVDTEDAIPIVYLHFKPFISQNVQSPYLPIKIEPGLIEEMQWAFL